MPGYEDGEQWTQGGDTFTVNSTNDPKAGDGGYYVSQSDGKDHATAVFTSDGYLADTKANKDWE